MLARALAAGVPCGVGLPPMRPTGRDQKFRAWLEQRRIGYVVAVACSHAVPADAGSSRADALAAHAPQQAWKRRSCGEGAKGPRIFDWAAASLPDPEDSAARVSRQLLVRRSLTRNPKASTSLPTTCAPPRAGTTDEDLIRVAGPAGISKSATAATCQAGFVFHGCPPCPSSCVSPVSAWGGGAQRARV